jgi:uncharacterized membrane protein YdbT with pleckstrin-like domain
VSENNKIKMPNPLQDNDVSSPPAETIKWSYSGKAMRTQAYLFVLLSLALVSGGVYATLAGLFDTFYLLIWYIITGSLILLWGYYYAVYIYQIWTIQYKLTDKYLYHRQGLFTRVSGSLELIHIDDIRLIQTLFDRLLNGGVGSIVIFCASDKTNSKLILAGIDKPREIFEQINSRRTALRAKRAILTSGT